MDRRIQRYDDPLRLKFSSEDEDDDGNGLQILNGWANYHSTWLFKLEQINGFSTGERKILRRTVVQYTQQRRRRLVQVYAAASAAAALQTKDQEEDHHQEEAKTEEEEEEVTEYIAK